MRKSARPYLAALLLGALLIPPAPLASQVSARPSVAFLVAVQTEALARNAFGALLPGSTFAPHAGRPPEPAAEPAPQGPVAQVAPRSAQPAKKPAYHVVASGDTLWSLAGRYRTSVGALARDNGVSETAILQLGQRLAVAGGTAAARPSAARPAAARPSSTITVRSGQTLSDIAQAYGVSTRALVEANGLSSAHRIRAGQRLTIPGRAAAAA
ncbi:MAG: LysM peptidoglycan-binding domain-containing protein, partial [bacterium]